MSQKLSPTHSYDVVIVGSGPVGATFARTIRDARPRASILMVEAGPNLTDPAGINLKDVSDLAQRAELQRLSQGPDQRFYGVSSIGDRARAARVPDGKRDSLARPGTYLLSASGSTVEGMPSAALSMNVGGMGAHWVCASPWPYGDERATAIPAAEWDRMVAGAQRTLRTSGTLFPRTALHDHVLGSLAAFFPGGEARGRQVQNMPMAGRVVDGRISWTGPGTILGDLLHGDDAFELRAQTLCTRVLLGDEGAEGVEVRDLRTGETLRIRADLVVIAGDAFRTPQLLWASGLRQASIGQGLTEHAQLVSAIDLELPSEDSAAGGASDDPVVGVFWIPYDGIQRPFHGQITQLDLSPLSLAEEESPRASTTTVGLSYFIPTEVRPENRVDFDAAQADWLGMPRMHVQFSRSAEDARRIEVARTSQRALVEALRPDRPADVPALMPAGTSLHYTGTTAIGDADDGSAVCDPWSRVWGLPNLFLGGNGLIPTSMAGNPTLTSVALALRAAERAADELL